MSSTSITPGSSFTVTCNPNPEGEQKPGEQSGRTWGEWFSSLGGSSKPEGQQPNAKVGGGKKKKTSKKGQKKRRTNKKKSLKWFGL
jgi:hypothetical protein